LSGQLEFIAFTIMALAAARARNSTANFSGCRALVVGGTSGIGQGIALRLAQANFSVTLMGRNIERGNQIVAELATKGGKDHDFMTCDASLLANVKTAAAAFAERHPTLDVLVEAQGIASMAGRTETSEGIDEKLALHYYSRMAFVQALLPQLRKSTSPRVLSVLSAGVHAPYAHYDTDPELRTHFSLKNAADAAGFYNDLALDSFARQPENANVTFIHAAPGFVNTNWGTELPWILRGVVRIFQPLATSPADCAEFMCAPLLAPHAGSKRPDEAGVVLLNSSAEPVRKTALHEKAREAVWQHTRELLAKHGL